MNVWRKGRKVDRNFIANVCSGDIDHDGFDLSLIIKDAHAVNAVKDTIRSNWKVFYQNFIEKMMTEDGMEHYPEMSYHTAMSYADSSLNDSFQKVPLIVE